ncbi:MAG TPA: prolyl oligopeptidase family serine peptidase [Candidatus Binatia bacterium]|nr:prolyl oligopeptidase family serine peptidase [Candidatus Binatia bacterium]
MTDATPRALIRAQVALTSFRLSADGTTIVYALRRVRGNDDVSHLWSRPFDGGRARQLTRGRVRDGTPAPSPDGRQLAFVRSPVGDPEAVGQVWVLPLDGGEAWQLTSLKHGVAGVHWSPDGRQLALVAQAGDHRFVIGEERKGRTPTARRITRLDFRDDESGHVVRRAHLWLVAPRPGARPRQLTSGDFDVLHPAWSPDGSRIAFTADRGTDSTIYPRLQLWSIGTRAARPRIRELVSLAGDADWPAFSPDGRHLAFVGTDVEDPPDEVPPAAWVMRLPSGTPRNLTGSLDRPIGEWAWCDLLLAEEAPGPAWLDNGTLAVIVGDRGRNIPHRLSLDGDAAPLVDPALRIAAAGIEAAAGHVVVSAAMNGSSSEAFAVEDNGRLRQITREGSAWQRRFPAVSLDELELEGPGGPIHAWLASPPDAGRRRLPTVLHVHGGPTGAWAPGGTLDAMAMCAAGYRVLMPNIRGSTTFGGPWVQALSASWGSVDAADALAAVDALVERGLADRRRLVVMGLSYGGFLTQWLIGVDDRFAAAASENGVANQASAWANSYFGVHYNRRAGLGEPLSDEGMQQLWSSSPLRNARHVTTPLLMLQAEEDRICPPADNEQLFTALKVLGREVEYILYPDEHHEMKSYGRPDRRIDRLERTLAWFEKHLGR